MPRTLTTGICALPASFMLMILYFETQKPYLLPFL
jgi:hypothetical protein